MFGLLIKRGNFNAFIPVVVLVSTSSSRHLIEQVAEFLNVERKDQFNRAIKWGKKRAMEWARQPALAPPV